MFCNVCGRRSLGDSRFCSGCGAVLNSVGDLTTSVEIVDVVSDGGDPAQSMQPAPEDSASGAAALIVSTGAQHGYSFPLGDPLTRLGRDPNSEIALDDITVSRRHVEIERTQKGYVARDVGWLNGTYLNQRRIHEATLCHGDELQVGKFRLVYITRTNFR